MYLKLSENRMTSPISSQIDIYFQLQSNVLRRGDHIETLSAYHSTYVT